eukprot:2364402-Rhodomonas_salina.3
MRLPPYARAAPTPLLTSGMWLPATVLGPHGGRTRVPRRLPDPDPPSRLVRYAPTRSFRRIPVLASV